MLAVKIRYPKPEPVIVTFREVDEHSVGGLRT
jgi:hypothetical protein